MLSSLAGNNSNQEDVTANLPGVFNIADDANNAGVINVSDADGNVLYDIKKNQDSTYFSPSYDLVDKSSGATVGTIVVSTIQNSSYIVLPASGDNRNRPVKRVYRGLEFDYIETSTTYKWDQWNKNLTLKNDTTTVVGHAKRLDSGLNSLSWKFNYLPDVMDNAFLISVAFVATQQLWNGAICRVANAVRNTPIGTNQ